MSPLPLLLAALAAAPAYSPPDETAAFRPGPGVELAQRHCRACHSADYVTTQPPKMPAGFWKAEVTKMVNVFGARISEDDAARIVDYLDAAYRQP